MVPTLSPPASGSRLKQSPVRIFPLARKLLGRPERQFSEAVVITPVQLLEGPPQKFGTAKNVQISARFLTTFEFDGEYLRNGSTYRTSEKNLINHYLFHAGRKK